MKNYSKQREAIMEVLRSTTTHPTAQWIYEEVRKQLPKISLGTVYRNLSALSAEGDILNISVGDGFEHFDGDNSPHLHLHCRCCGKIVDANLSKHTPRNIALKNGFTPETELYVITGVCKNCQACND
ncbi:MAG: transcriptional repressor [Ruminococcaceae bacterium]|nr:transcriptional repressor [Oscillospiraceae bacterium]